MTPTERAQLISDAIEGDPGEANEPARPRHQPTSRVRQP